MVSLRRWVLKVVHFESKSQKFAKEFRKAMSKYKPPVQIKIVRSYETNTGCIINHSCVLVLGEDYTKLTIANKERKITDEEESYFYSFLIGSIKNYFIARNQKFKGGFVTSITNKKDLLEK